jgi:hypothetical protein
MSDPTHLESDMSSGPFACDICKKTYTRADHLVRHYRTRRETRLERTMRKLTSGRYERKAIYVQMVWEIFHQTVFSLLSVEPGVMV